MSVELLDEVRRSWILEEEEVSRKQLLSAIRYELSVLKGFGPLKRFLQRWHRIFAASRIRLSLASERLEQREAGARRSLKRDILAEWTALWQNHLLQLEELWRRSFNQATFFQRHLLFRGELLTVREIERNELLFSAALSRMVIEEREHRQRVESSAALWHVGVSAKGQLFDLPDRESVSRDQLGAAEATGFAKLCKTAWHSIRYYQRRELEAQEFEARRGGILNEEAEAREFIRSNYVIDKMLLGK
jgi:hypothetical protein